MSARELLIEKIKVFLNSHHLEETNFTVTINTSTNFGDLTTNIAMVVFPKLKDKFKSSRETADYILEELKKDKDITKLFKEIHVDGPGFINFYLSDQEIFAYAKNLKSLLLTPLAARKIMVEYAHPNTHKEFHVGHLRTLLLGESIARLNSFVGNKVYRANYQGDIGPHVAKAVYGILKVIKDEKIDFAQMETKSVWEKAKLLQRGYTLGNQEYESNKEAIDKLNADLYTKASEHYKLYETTRKWSLEYFDAIYKLFGVKFDGLYFESQTAECGKKTVLENVGKVFEDDGGTIIFEGERYGLHTRVFVTKEGNPTYEGKDICRALQQYEAFPFDREIHVVASEQSEYFKVVFKALELVDSKFSGKEFHLSMGMVNLTSGKMSSRTGEIVSGWDLWNMVRTEVEKLAKEGKVKQDEKEDTINKITKASIMYSFLKVTPNLNLTFDISTSVALDGESGPYILYTLARINSVLEKAPQISDAYEFEEKDLLILRKIYGFTEMAQDAAEKLTPNTICTWVYELAREFNAYYQEVPILKAQKPELLNARIMIITYVKDSLEKGLNLLGIEPVARM